MVSLRLDPGDLNNPLSGQLEEQLEADWVSSKSN